MGQGVVENSENPLAKNSFSVNLSAMKPTSYLKRHKLSNLDVARECGFSPSLVSYVMRGEKPASWTFMLRFMRMTGGRVTPNDWYDVMTPSTLERTEGFADGTEAEKQDDQRSQQGSA